MDFIRFCQPNIEWSESLRHGVEFIIDSGLMTNGEHCRYLEREFKKIAHSNYAIAVSSCTTGLMMVAAALNVDEYIYPNYSFIGTKLSGAWCDSRHVFSSAKTYMDVDPRTWCLDPDAVKEYRYGKSNPAMIIATHVFGRPADVLGLERVNFPKTSYLVFDAAHATGSKIPLGKDGRMVGDASVYSLSPTKLVTGGEGGVICVNDRSLYEKLLSIRDYGRGADGKEQMLGLNGRLSEVNACVAIHSLWRLEEEKKKREEVARAYHEGLRVLDGISFQDCIEDGNYDISSHKDFTIMVDPVRFGCSRDELGEYLNDEGIETKIYYPELLSSNKSITPVSKRLTEQCLSLPIHGRLKDILSGVEHVIMAVERAQKLAKGVSV